MPKSDPSHVGAHDIGCLQSWAQKIGRADTMAGFSHFACYNIKKILTVFLCVRARLKVSSLVWVEEVLFTGNKNLLLRCHNSDQDFCLVFIF